MAEWPKAPVLKTGEPQGSGGSNPSPSALRRASLAQGRPFFRDENPRVPGFVYCRRRAAAGMAGAKRQPPQGQEHREMLAAIPPLPPFDAKPRPPSLQKLRWKCRRAGLKDRLICYSQDRPLAPAASVLRRPASGLWPLSTGFSGNALIHLKPLGMCERQRSRRRSYTQDRPSDPAWSAVVNSYENPDPEEPGWPI